MCAPKHIMLALLQRVKHANVVVHDKKIADIGKGLLVFAAVEPEDTVDKATRLIEKILKYRIFDDANGKMNLSIQDVAGELLLVSQFTLAVDTKKGLRPSFTTAAAPEIAEKLFDKFIELAKEKYDKNKIATGEFGADMQVSLCNDGPVTFFLRN